MDDYGLGIIKVEHKPVVKKTPGRKKVKEPKGSRENVLAEKLFENVMEVENAFISGTLVEDIEDGAGFVIVDRALNMGRVIYHDPARECFDITPESHPHYFNKPKERVRGR